MTKERKNIRDNIRDNIGKHPVLLDPLLPL